jgi:hypothetical protein
LGHVE